MYSSVVQALRDQIRGITGALLVVGLTFHYTMETWWLGWTLPIPYLLGFALIGLSIIVAITRSIGFHRTEQNQTEERNPKWMIGVDIAEILLQSFIAAFVLLSLLGIIDRGSSVNLVMRLGLIEVVPLGFGAALANRLFGSTSQEEAQKEMQFPENVALFSIGAIFVASTIAPTQEMELIAAHMGWLRHLLLIALTIVLVYLVLYELDFQGQRGRSQDDLRLEIGTAFLVYMVGAVTAFALLTGFGHFSNATLALMYQETTVLAFPASLGAAGAQVMV